MKEIPLEKKALSEMIERENAYWNDVFMKEMKNPQKKAYSSYWWENYYQNITNYVKLILREYNNPKVLEAGSGSGKASVVLGKNIDRTFLDISPAALEYARYLAKRFNARGIKFVEGNIFSMPFKEKSFDLVWNIGVIEHYPAREASKVIGEMFRVLKSRGKMVVAVPNFNSGPMIKARLIKHPLLKFIPGYRITTEYNYSVKDLKKMIYRAAEIRKLKINKIDVKMFGNPLIMESPKWLILSLGKVIEYVLPKNKFLIFIVCEVE